MCSYSGSSYFQPHCNKIISLCVPRVDLVLITVIEGQEWDSEMTQISRICQVLWSWRIITGRRSDWSGTAAASPQASSKESFIPHERRQLRSQPVMMAPYVGAVCSIVLRRRMVLLSTSQEETTSLQHLLWERAASSPWLRWVTQWESAHLKPPSVLGDMSPGTAQPPQAVVPSPRWGFTLIKWHGALLPFFILKWPPYSPISAAVSEPDRGIRGQALRFTGFFCN